MGHVRESARIAQAVRRTPHSSALQESGRFTHVVFGTGTLSGNQTHIECSIGPIQVDTTQVLAMRDARRIIRRFVETRSFHPDFTATDVTARFAESDTGSIRQSPEPN